MFRSCTKDGVLPLEWEKAIFVLAHKKGNKQTLKNCRPISLLPIFGKIFERLMCNEMSEYFSENNLLHSNQSGFKPGDSCIS